MTTQAKFRDGAGFQENLRFLGMRNRDNPQKKFKGIFTKFLENVKRVVYTVVSECAEFKSDHCLELRLTCLCVLRHTTTETTKKWLSSIHTEIF